MLSTGLLTGLAAAFILGAVVAGQPQRPPATLDDLLQEVRGLRADLAQQSTASLRVQALVARVSLQEQRLKALSLQFAEADAAAASAADARESQERHLAELENLLDQDLLPGGVTREMLQAERESGRRELVRLQTLEMRSTSRREELSGLLTAEEARWMDLNSRLDALEQGPPR